VHAPPMYKMWHVCRAPPSGRRLSLLVSLRESGARGWRFSRACGSLPQRLSEVVAPQRVVVCRASLPPSPRDCPLSTLRPPPVACEPPFQAEALKSSSRLSAGDSFATSMNLVVEYFLCTASKLAPVAFLCSSTSCAAHGRRCASVYLEW
jgi:hypothetical protein